MKLIVGLGNPGKEYERTRHNVGFFVLDALREKLKQEGVNQWELSKKFNALVAGCTINNDKIILAKPMTFMNDSGVSVQLLMHFYKITPTDLIVVHDDKDIALGTFKIQTDRGAAGHNGVTSIIERIGSQNFTRIRIGIAPSNPKKMAEVDKFVLGRFGLFEKNTVGAVMEKVVEEILKQI